MENALVNKLKTDFEQTWNLNLNVFQKEVKGPDDNMVNIFLTRGNLTIPAIFVYFNT